LFWLLVQIDDYIADSRSIKDSTEALNNWTEKEGNGKQCFNKLFLNRKHKNVCK